MCTWAGRASRSCGALRLCVRKEVAPSVVAYPLTGGAKLVDLQDARSAAHVEARFCAALEVEQVRLSCHLGQQ